MRSLRKVQEITPKIGVKMPEKRENEEEEEENGYVFGRNTNKKVPMSEREPQDTTHPLKFNEVDVPVFQPVSKDIGSVTYVPRKKDEYFGITGKFTHDFSAGMFRNFSLNTK